MRRIINSLRRNWFVALSILVMLAIIVWSANGLFGPGTAQKQLRIAVIVENDSEDYWTSFKSGLEQSAKEHNVILSYAPSIEFSNISEEKALIEQEIQAGVDGVIISMCSDYGAEEVLSKIPYDIPVVLIQSDITREISDKNKVSTITYDNSGIGASIVRLIRNDYGDDLGNKTIGIIGGNQRQLGMKNLLLSVKTTLESYNGDIIWVDSTNGSVSSIFESYVEPDILIALDSKSMKAASGYLMEHPLYGADLYGAGSGATNVYYLERNVIDGMVVSNEFNMGYQSVDCIVDMKRDSGYQMDAFVDYREVMSSDIYDEDIERILFPMVQ